MCLIGDFGVGKTSLIRRFVDGQFSDKYLSTVGVKISRKNISVIGKDAASADLQLLIWDLEGHTKFKAIAPSYLQGSKGALVVADVSRPETLERIIEHLDLFFSVSPQGCVIIALNKIDLIEPEKAIKILEDSKNIYQDKVLSIYNTSAKTGEDVDTMFKELAQNMN
jgi:small GTP-binding protein